MEPDRAFDDYLKEILNSDKRYDKEAYHLVRGALDYTMITLGRQGHVTGQELLEGIRKFTLSHFGPMSKFVLNEWGIHECLDIGNIVFNMVNSGLLGRTEQDSIDDFKTGYDFSDVFEKPYKVEPERGGHHDGREKR